MIFPSLIKVGLKSKLSGICKSAVLRTILALRTMEPWALKMLDAFGKPGGGVLLGALTSFGSFDECLNVEASEFNKRTNQTERYFSGQYCAVELHPPLPPKPRYYTVHHRLKLFENFTKSAKILSLISDKAHFFYFLSFRLGVCIPSTCSSEDLVHVITRLIGSYGFTVSVPHCETEASADINSSQIAIMCVFGILGIFILVGTAYDILSFYCCENRIRNKRSPRGTFTRILTSLSFNSNISKVLETKTSLDKLEGLHGLRALSMTWIISGNIFFVYQIPDFPYDYNYFGVDCAPTDIDTVHRIGKKTTENKSPRQIVVKFCRQLLKAVSFSGDLAFQPFLSSTLALDTFFLSSGLLTSYVILKPTYESERKTTLLMLLLHKIYRMVPAHMTVIALAMLLPLLGSGPVWHETVDPIVTKCQKSWWANLLFINNIVLSAKDRVCIGDFTAQGSWIFSVYSFHEQCLEHSWYVACELQLFVVSMAVVYLMQRKPKLGILLSCMLTILAVIITGLLTFYYVLPPTVLFAQADQSERLTSEDLTYHKPYAHLGAFCTGLVIGYKIAKKSMFNIKPYIQLILWLLATGCNLSLVLGIHPWNKGNETIETADSAIYAATHRTLWAFGVGWMVFACITGNGGIINRILCWRGWIPLSRLTFLTYLLHPLVQMTLVASVKERLQADQYIALYLFSGLLLISFSMASFVSLFLDMPLRQLENLFIDKIMKGFDSRYDIEGRAELGKVKDKNYFRTDIQDKHIRKRVLDNKTFCESFDGKTFVCHL
ncbi:nose resistant to fluoxetine protein 6-like [Tachypleus tridentatus]|uniref:nose resistant to fluoxetine protein 6-like n=1 Tax=Tachypleus tridentatus TaxID=6853 RepID=UPI003FCF7E82